MRLLLAFVALLILKPVQAGDFEDGMSAVNRDDYVTASDRFLSAASRGNVYAQYNLGILNYRGQGVKQNYKEAERWFRLSAEQGYAAAQYNLGVMYIRWHGVPQDYKQAAYWYRLAAHAGDAAAQFNLGLLYAHGLGVIQDRILAHMWMNIAAIGGDKVRQKSRDLVASEMTPLAIEQAQRMARDCVASNFVKCD